MSAIIYDELESDFDYDVDVVFNELVSDVFDDMSAVKTVDVASCITRNAHTFCDQACMAGYAFSMSSCHPGCSSCCTLFVSIFPGEARVIAEQIKTIPKPEFDMIVSRIKRNAKIEANGVDDYIKTRAKCAFLDRSSCQCMIYHERPLACRLYDSLDVDACKAGVGDPDAGIPRSVSLLSTDELMNRAITLVYERFGLVADKAPLHLSVIRALTTRNGNR